MAIPILAAIGAKVALPIVGKLLGGTALKGLLGGLLGKAGLGSMLGTITKFLPLAKNILGSLGRMGLSAMKPPSSMGRIANLGYSPPSPGAHRPGGMLGGMGMGGIGRLLGGLQKLMGGLGQPSMQTKMHGQLQRQMNSVQNMLDLMSNMQRQMHDIAMQTMQSLRG